jgi:hypothetical protein
VGSSVNQPPSGGTDYPLVAPSADVAGLAADFHLAVTASGVPPTPLSLWWLGGFGALPAALYPGTPEQTHPLDLVVKDADGAVVFDSTAADRFRDDAYGGTLRVATWSAGGAVARLAYDPTPAGSLYDNIYPADGRLDPRTVWLAPPGLRTLKVGATELAGVVGLGPGHNVTVARGGAVTAPSPRRAVSGGRRTSYVDFRAVPGAGLGVVDDCEDGPGPVKALAGARPGPGGTLALDAAGCLRAQNPVHTVGAYGARTATPTPGLLSLHNGCGPRCPCSAFARTYKGVSRLWNRGRGVAGAAQGARDLVAENKARWEAQKACREGNPLRLAATAEAGCKATVGGAFCNPTDGCLSPLQLRFTFRVVGPAGDVTLSSPGYVCPPAYVSGPRTDGDEPYALGGEWPVYDAYFDALDPRAVATVRFRVCVPGCDAATVISGAVTAHAPGDAPEADVPSWVSTLWSLAPDHPARAALTRAVPLRDDDPFTHCRC